MVHILMRFGNKIYLVCVLRFVMDMGVRPASQICCRFTEEYLDEWRRRMDVFVAEQWLPNQSHELQALLAERRATLGPHQARPYWASVFTDDYKKQYVGPELAASGESMWLQLHDSSKVWMAKAHKKTLGTVNDWIGGRYVYNGGFGCFPPSKRTRALADCTKAVNGEMVRSEYRSFTSFIVSHAAEILALDGIKGLSAPLKTPGYDADKIIISDAIKAKISYVAEQLQRRPAASFMSAIDDSAKDFTSTARTYSSSDACTDAERTSIFLSSQGVAFDFVLDSEWLSRHISVLEAVGETFQFIEYGRILSDEEHVIEGDSYPARPLLSATHSAGFVGG